MKTIAVIPARGGSKGIEKKYIPSSRLPLNLLHNKVSKTL